MEYKIDSSIIDEIKECLSTYSDYKEKKELSDRDKIKRQRAKEDLGFALQDFCNACFPELYKLIKLDRLDISIEDIQKALDSFELTYKLREGRAIVVYEADNDFPHDIVIVFSAEDGWIGCTSYPIGCDITDETKKNKVLAMMNEYNHTTRHSKAYIDDEGTVLVNRNDSSTIIWDINDLKELIATDISVACNFFKENRELLEVNM